MTRASRLLTGSAIVLTAAALLTLGSLPAFAAPTITASGTGTVLMPLATIATGAASEVNGVAATDSHLYVADGPHDQILVYSLEGVSQSAISLSSGDFPLDLALSPDKSQLYVSDLGSGRISTINLATSAVTSFAAVSSNYGITVSPDGSMLYVLANGDAQVHEFTTTGIALATSTSNSIYATPAQIAVSPDGATVYVSYRDAIAPQTSGGLRLLRASDLSEFASIDVQNAEALAVNSAGEIFVGTNDGNPGGGSIQEYNAVTFLPVNPPLPTGNEPATAVVAPDGSTLYVGDGNGGQLYAVDTSGHTVSGHLGSAGGAESLAVSPDGVHVYSSSGNVVPGTVYPFAFLKLTLTAPASVTPGTGATAFDALLDDGASPIGDHSGDSVLIEIVDATNTVRASGSAAPGAASGAASITLNLATLPVGTYSVRATLTGPDGTIVATAAGFTVAAAGSTALAATGVDAALPVGIALLLVLAGAIVLLARRRTAARA